MTTRLLQLYVRVELFLNILLRLVLSDAPLDGGVAHTLMIPLSAVMRHETGKELWLFLSRDQGLYQCDIYANAIGDTTGTNLVCMKLCNDMNLLRTTMRTDPGIAVGRGWRALVVN